MSEQNDVGGVFHCDLYREHSSVFFRHVLRFSVGSEDAKSIKENSAKQGAESRDPLWDDHRRQKVSWWQRDEDVPISAEINSENDSFVATKKGENV